MRQVEDLLVVGVAVHGRHEAVLEAKVVHHDFHDRDEAVGRARRVRDDVMLGGIVLLVVHAHTDGDVLALGGCRDHDLLGAGGQVLGRALLIGEAPCALEHELDAEFLPGKLLGFFDRRDPDQLAVDFERIALCVDRPRKAAVHRVVLEQVRQRLGVGDVVDGDELERALLPHHRRP